MDYTDEQIMTIDEAINHCHEVANRKCDDCGKEHLQLARWLEELVEARKYIKHLKAENERLNSLCTSKDVIINDLNAKNESLNREIKSIESETRKKFAKRLKKEYIQGFWEEQRYIDIEDIDNLLEEMEKGNE